MSAKTRKVSCPTLLLRCVKIFQKYGDFSRPNTGKYLSENTPYLNTFHAVLFRPYFQKIELFLSRWHYFLRSKNKVNFTETCLKKNQKQGYVHMRKYAEYIISKVSTVYYKN